MSELLPKAAVCIFAFDTRGKVLSVTRRNTKIWSLPGGKVDDNETLTAALNRELEEETGFWIAPQLIVPIYSEVVVGDDGNDFYCTAFWYPKVIPRFEGDDGYVWSQEEGIDVSFIAVDELLTGAFSDFNRRALENLGRVKLYKKMQHERNQ